MGEDGGHRTRSTNSGRFFLGNSRFLPPSSVLVGGGGRREGAILSLSRHDFFFLGGCGCGALFCQANLHLFFLIRLFYLVKLWTFVITVPTDFTDWSQFTSLAPWSRCCKPISQRKTKGMSGTPSYYEHSTTLTLVR